MTSDSISSFFGKLASTAKSIVKIAIHSRPHSIVKSEECDRPVIIMGNGPSLAETIRDFRELLLSHPTLAVNFAANAPEFTSLKPRYYVLADPHFFKATDNENVMRLRANLGKVDWKMTLFIPAREKSTTFISNNPHVTVRYFNPVGVEGFDWIENLAFKRGYGMPRPRNVLIPSIMIAMSMGFNNIYITGADHSWMRTISVNERNEVVSIQPHFYKEDDKEIERVKTDYLRYPLHQIVYSFYVAFRSYFTIQRYALYRGVNIYNATPGSFIDAFPRRFLDHLI